MGKNFKYNIVSNSWLKVTIALVIAVVTLTGLFYSPSSVNAVSVGITNLPATITSGTNLSFTTQVTINTNERIPIDSLRLDLTGPTNALVTFDANGTITGQSGQFVSIVRNNTPVNNFGFRSGSGYGDDSNINNSVDLAVNSRTDETEIYYNGSNWVCPW